jgi:hypothetical protein
MTIHKLIVQTARPGSRGYPHGATVEGYWMQDGDYVWLTSENGTKLGERRRLEPGVDAVTIARLLLKSSFGRKRSDFNRKLVYPAGF